MFYSYSSSATEGTNTLFVSVTTY